MGNAVEVLPMVDKNIVKIGATLNHSNQVKLCEKFTGEEVRKALFDMDFAKAPGMGLMCYSLRKLGPL